MKIRTLQTKYYWRQGLPVKPLESKLPVIIGLDQSYLGYGVKVGDISGRHISLFEMSGANMGVDNFIEEFTDYFIDLFLQLDIMLVGYEKMILKEGMKYYHSSEILHDIRVATKNFFISRTGTAPEEINNHSWKSSILPDGYRSRNEKGSLRFLRDEDPIKYKEATHNMTDAECIYRYLYKNFRDLAEIVCIQKEEPANKFKIAIIDPDSADHLTKKPYKKFKYNGDFSAEDNAAYYSNRSDMTGLSIVKAEDLSLEDIYKYASGFELPPYITMVVVTRQS